MRTKQPRKPSIYSGPAARYAAPGERIYEISSPFGGGLISVSNEPERGFLDVHLTRLDPTVRVSVDRRAGQQHSTLGVIMHLTPLLDQWMDGGHGDPALADAIAVQSKKLLDLLLPTPSVAEVQS